MLYILAIGSRGGYYNAEAGEFAHSVVEEPVIDVPIIEELAGNEIDI